MRLLLRYTLLVWVVCISQTTFGNEWRFHAPFSGTEGMAETRQRVYFTSAGALFAYDKENDETYSLNVLNYLNDNDVTGVFAPFHSTFAIVAYANGNIDLLYDNGKVVNLPDIKDSRLEAKGIVDVAVSPTGDTMLILTKFGLVRYDLKKMEVIDSGVISGKLERMGYLDGHPIVFHDDHLKLMTGDASMRDLSTWLDLGIYAPVQLINIGESLYGVTYDNGVKRPVMFLFDDATGTLSYKLLGTQVADKIVPGSLAEPLLVVNGNTISVFNSDNENIGTRSLPLQYVGKVFTGAEGSDNLWIGTDDGISAVDATSVPAYVSEPIKPGDFSVRKVQFLTVAPSGNIYAGNRGNSNIYNVTTTDHRGYIAMISPDGNIKDVTPKGLSKDLTGNVNPEGYLFDLLFIREDPDDNSILYAGDLHEGFYALSTEDGRELVHYTPENSSLTDYWGVRAQDIGFDPRGYLWLMSEREPGTPSLMVLTPEGRLKGKDVAQSDWQLIESSKDFYAARDGMMVVSSNGRYIYLMGNNDLFVYDTNGTGSLSDDWGEHVTNFRMSDGSGYMNYQRFLRIMEDVDGSLWVATSDGVFYIKEPWEVANGTVDIVRPKVSRNDGTGLADYLLATQMVQDMCNDGAGHKWIVTRDSGVFLVSGDGTSILETHNASNSPLPSNCVYSVAVSQDGSGKVYFGTDYGLLEYTSSYMPGKDDLKDVRIYPNPIRPDYYGGVTIEGLVDGSLVKILGASGTLVDELRSEGGKVEWSGRDARGGRVPSGVYHVFVSSEKSGGKPVGKIVVVR